MKKITLLIFMCFASLGFAQTFTDSAGPYDMQNGNGATAATCGTVDELTLPLTVSGVGVLGTTNVIESVELNITHTWNADVVISLQDPSGTTTVLLVEDVGERGDNFTNCILQDGGAALPTVETSPVTGTFAPLEPLSGFNGGTIDADGDWNLLVCDAFNGDIGAIDSWSITFAVTPTCSNPSGVAVSNVLDVSADVSWTAGLGAASYDWELVPGGNAQGVDVITGGNTTFTSIPFAGLTADTAYSFYIKSDCETTYTGPTDFTTLGGPPPANDLCAGAVTATQETGVIDAASAAPVAGTVEFGINSDDTFTCFAGGNPSDDVWYSFTALTSTVVINIEANFDAALTLYSGTCGSLIQVACADDTTTTGLEEITAVGLTIGETYYFRTYDWFTAASTDPTFVYKLWSPDTLSNVTFENDTTFNLFPNPVKEQLSIRAQNNIQNVSVYNMLGQEVLRSAPNAISTDLNTSGLQTGTYFAKVTINNVTETVQILKR